ncbi:MAG: ATP-dependent carboxylate-amine ligase [Alphaproteobacteria bacterium]|nr:ATP-dependent carboxylate-amine ligase [Alphaproteobacteria bacterium]
MDQGYFPKLLAELCAEIGAGLTFEPAFRRAGIIIFANGRRRFFKGTNLDLNSSAAAQIAQDKDFCAKFLTMAGLNCPDSQVVFAPKCIAKWKAKNPALAASLDPFADAEAAARNWGFPLFVKPNDGAEGEGVQLVHTADELRSHLNALYAEHDRVLVQRPAPGDDFRIVVLDGEMMLAYQRLPLTVTGNGRHTIADLLAQRAKQLSAAGRQAIALVDDPRVAAHLASQNLSITHCPEPGQSLRLLANANLSAGGEVVDVTDKVHARYKQIAKDAADAVGLRFAGIDVLCAAVDQVDPGYTVLEVNAAPGLNNFAATSGQAHQRVSDLYRTLLKTLERESGPQG